MELDTQLSQRDFKERIAEKARRNVSRVWYMGMRYGGLSVRAGINVYKALVRSVLEYGAEVWNPAQWEEGERVQREMGRRILRCHGKTTNEAVLGELGWWTLQARREYLKIKFWIRLCLLDDTRLVRRVYQLSREAYQEHYTNRNWCYDLHELLIKYDLECLWGNENFVRHPEQVPREEHTETRLKRYWETMIYNHVQRVEEENWKKRMAKKPKLRTYQTFKDKLKLESYLLSEKEKTGRYLLTSIRTGTNKLRIETGRWKKRKEKVEERVCIQCGSGEIEDEKHFILHCSRYGTLRNEMYDKVWMRAMIKLDIASEGAQWKFLMDGGLEKTQYPDLQDLLKKFVRKALSLRILTE
jgi:hypothetical protein